MRTLTLLSCFMFLSCISEPKSSAEALQEDTIEAAADHFKANGDYASLKKVATFFEEHKATVTISQVKDLLGEPNSFQSEGKLVYGTVDTALMDGAEDQMPGYKYVEFSFYDEEANVMSYLQTVEYDLMSE